MATSITGKRVAILATDGVEQVELTKPRDALDAAGAITKVVSPKSKIRAWKTDDWGDDIDVDISLKDARCEDFDALLLPGGVMNPDKLRQEPKAVELVRDFVMSGKPIAAICHGPWMLVEAGAVRGRTGVTSWPSLQTDIKNAGGDWVDREVVSDEGIVTSRKPDDIPAFNNKMIEQIAEGSYKEIRQTTHASVRPAARA